MHKGRRGSQLFKDDFPASVDESNPTGTNLSLLSYHKLGTIS